jgi:hypothetical protein
MQSISTIGLDIAHAETSNAGCRKIRDKMTSIKRPKTAGARQQSGGNDDVSG